MTFKRSILMLLTLSSPLAFAAPIAFSAFTESSERNEYCYLRINEPIFLATGTASPRTKKFVVAANASRSEHVRDLRSEFTELTGEPEACKDYQSAVQIDFNFEIKTNLDAKIVSILYTDARYTGGAHGGRALSAETFNVETGEYYRNLAAFLPDDQINPLKSKILEILKLEDGFDPSFGFESWSGETTSLRQVSNFYFTPNGIDIFFQEYEVGPYSSGIITAHLSWEDLKELGYKGQIQ